MQNAWQQDPRATATYAPGSIEALLQQQDLSNWQSSGVNPQGGMGPQLLSEFRAREAAQANRAQPGPNPSDPRYSHMVGPGGGAFALNQQRGAAMPPQGITSLAPPAQQNIPPAYTPPAPRPTTPAPAQTASYLDYYRAQAAAPRAPMPLNASVQSTSGNYTMPPSITPIPAAPAPSPGGAPSASDGQARGGLLGVGQYLRGAGDGMSDHIPAQVGGPGGRQIRVAANEYVVPADVVSHLGNGSSDAGARVLDQMGSKVRKARTGNAKQGRQINPGKFMPR